MTEVRFDKNPDAVFLGDLTRNRVAYDHNGKKLERTTLSKLMVVYLRKPEVTNG